MESLGFSLPEIKTKNEILMPNRTALTIVLVFLLCVGGYFFIKTVTK